MPKCPYCGRDTHASERHCWFCEQDISKVVDEEEKAEYKRKKRK